MKDAQRIGICDRLREHQRERVVAIKSRIMIENRLISVVAVGLGFRTGLDEVARKKAWEAAKAVINQIENKKWEHPKCEDIAGYVDSSKHAINGYDFQIKLTEKSMVKLAKQLPVARWVESPDRRGFGLQSLAILIGECGDLANYEAPGKLWRRMGCAPFEKDGVHRMGATWKSKTNGKGLSAAEWEEFGYCPRRRSITYLFGENIVKLNKGGPYRQRYDEVKERCRETHPEWFVCSLCKGSGKAKKGTACSNCKGGEVTMHAHRHAMLLATKRLLKDLWCQWNPDLVREMVY